MTALITVALLALLVAGTTLAAVGLVAIAQHRTLRRVRGVEQRLAAITKVNQDLRQANTCDPLQRRSVEREFERLDFSREVDLFIRDTFRES